MSSTLVTGATGFVGRAFSAELSARGRPFRALVRGPEPDRRLASPFAEIVAGDLLDPESLRRAASDCENVVHLAASVDPRERVGRERRYRANVAATTELAHFARARGARRFVFASSIAAMGFWSGTATAHSPCRPNGAYGCGKLEAERGLLKLAGPGFEVVVLRFPVMYGAGDRYTFLSWVQAVDRGLFRVIGSGNNAFPLCSSGNAARTLYAAIEGRLPTGVYLTADGADYSVRRIHRAIADALGRSPPRLRVPARVALAAAHLNEHAAHRFGLPSFITRDVVAQLTVDQRFDVTPLRERGVELRADLETETRHVVDDYRSRGLLNRRRGRAG